MDAHRETGETVWMTPQEAAAALKVTPKTVYDRARDGRLNSKTLEGRIMVEVKRDTP